MMCARTFALQKVTKIITPLKHTKKVTAHLECSICLDTTTVFPCILPEMSWRFSGSGSWWTHPVLSQLSTDCLVTSHWSLRTTDSLPHDSTYLRFMLHSLRWRNRKECNVRNAKNLQQPATVVIVETLCVTSALNSNRFGKNLQTIT